MKKKLFNIHKLIGVNMILFFFLSLFFGILTIFQPYVTLWEDSKKHITHTNIEDINIEQCLKQVSKRKYFNENGKLLRNDIIGIDFPLVEFRSNNLIRISNRANFYLDPQSCEKIKPKPFSISLLFNRIHTGAIFDSTVVKIIFGFMSVAIVFLSLSGIILIIKNRYKNIARNPKAYYAKYHRLLLLYTLPLVFMFGLTGALFNLGVYSSPLITHNLTGGKTLNVLKVDRNILKDPFLEAPEQSKKVKNLPFKELYNKAKDELKNTKFYKVQLYNYQDINAKVKFIGYEPHNYFISSTINESYIILDANNGIVLDKKTADEGTFTEKTFDTIFYLHYIKTFQDIPRVIFGIIAITMLIGLIYAMALWLSRTKEDKFSYKVLKPLSLSIILGSLVSASMMFASNWMIDKDYNSFVLLNNLYFTQEVLFYLVYIFMFIYIFITKEPYKIIKNSFYISSLLLLVAILSHNFMSGFSLFRTYKEEMYEIFFTDILLFVLSIIFFYFAKKLPKKYISFR